MLKSGVYPAAVTPLDSTGRVDHAGVARLLSWFEANGCVGAVLAGTNGEGPSLSAVEKRDLLRQAMAVCGRLDLILGIATPSLDEAVWLCKQAAAAEATAVLLMAPFYFRDAAEEGIEAWFMQVMDSAPLPVLVYNFPQKTGITLSPELIGRLSKHERFAGLKDSSGSRENLSGYKAAVDTEHVLYVGNEELLIEALDAGWTGTISGAANAIPMWLAQVVEEYHSADRTRENVEAKFELVLPAISALRSHKQPALNKALLHRLGVLPRPNVRPPLSVAPVEAVDAVADVLQSRLGVARG